MSDIVGAVGAKFRKKIRNLDCFETISWRQRENACFLLIESITSVSSALYWNRDTELRGQEVGDRRTNIGSAIQAGSVRRGPEGIPRKILRLRVLWNDFLACEIRPMLLPTKLFQMVYILIP